MAGSSINLRRPLASLSWPQNQDIASRHGCPTSFVNCPGDRNRDRRWIWKREVIMPRVALVTGGTRGIGAAISKALQAAGYKVAATYGGNDEAAQKFKSETGIAVFKWDVSSFDACAAGIKQVEAELGPVEVLVNNAGITRDAQLHRMKPEQWTEVINTNLGSLFNMCRNVI